VNEQVGKRCTLINKDMRIVSNQGLKCSNEMVIDVGEYLRLKFEKHYFRKG